MRFESPETDQTVYTRVGQDPPIYLFSRPANDVPAAYCDSTPTAASFCSEGSPGGSCTDSPINDDEDEGEFCSGGNDPTYCADGTAADPNGFCPANVNVITWPQRRNYFTGADALFSVPNSLGTMPAKISLTLMDYVALKLSSC